MRRANLIAFDDFVMDATPQYSSTELNNTLGEFDSWALQAIVDSPSNATAITVQLETSADGRNWSPKNARPELSGALVAGDTTVLQGRDPGTIGPGMALIRLKVTLAGPGAPPSAHVKVWIRGGDQAGTFLPCHLTGCKVWLRADLGITLNGANVARWADQSGNQNDAVQATATRQPAYNPLQLNGRPTLFFDASTAGSEKIFSLSTLEALTASHAFVVQRLANNPPISGGRSGLWRLGTSGFGTHYPFGPDGNIYDDGGGNTRYTCGAPSVNPANLNVYEAANGASWQSRINGTAQFASGTNTPGLSVTPELGGDSSSPSYYDGHWCEFFLYDRVLSAAERGIVVGYLNGLYGLGMV